jgi:hypothetical protein
MEVCNLLEEDCTCVAMRDDESAEVYIRSKQFFRLKAVGNGRLVLFVSEDLLRCYCL